MPFGVVGRLGPKMRRVDGVKITPREGAILEVNVGRSIVTNGEFVA